VTRFGTPETIQEALSVAEECFARAQALVSILAHYTDQNDNICSSDITWALETVDDLLYPGYSLHMDHWLNEEDLVKCGWTPPKSQAVQP
jgi:hypothetical protein